MNILNRLMNCTGLRKILRGSCVHLTQNRKKKNYDRRVFGDIPGDEYYFYADYFSSGDSLPIILTQEQ